MIGMVLSGSRENPCCRQRPSALPGRPMTNTEKNQLSGVKETLLYTLYYRAVDQRSKVPIVGDTWAADVLDQVTADNRKGLRTAKLGVSGRFPPLLRARRLDDWSREF